MKQASLESQRQRWLKTRHRGKRRYLITTMLLWGYPVGLASATFDIFPFSVENPFPTLGRFVVFLLFWGLAGLAFGHLSWTSAEKKFSSANTSNEEFGS